MSKFADQFFAKISMELKEDPDAAVDAIEQLVHQVISHLAVEARQPAKMGKAGVAVLYKPAERNGFFSELTQRYEYLSSRVERVSNTVIPSSSAARFLRALSLCYVALSTNKRLSKRDVYYMDVKLFKSQRHSNDALAAVCSALEYPRSSLNIVAAAKGFVQGNITFELDGHQTSCVQATMIPPLAELISSMDGKFDYVLVVEKETIFRKLCEVGFPDKHKCLLVTGKGFPGIATRQFLAKIATFCPSMDFFGLFDADAFGAAIYCNYKFGSKSSCLERGLELPSMHWIGVFLSDVDEFKAGQSALALDVRDKARIKSLAAQAFVQTDLLLKEQLEAMLSQGRKAEIEALCNRPIEFLADQYIPQQIAKCRERLHKQALERGPAPMDESAV